MSYSTDHLRTAGKITVYAAIVGIFVFAVAFIFNLGLKEVPSVGAQDSATTSVQVLNTAPLWTASTTEEFESSATNPTNAGSVVSWVAVGTDSNAEDYYLLICGTSASPTPNSSAAPTCSSGIQWAVSTATISGTPARAATTTLDAFAETNNWFAWICDGNAGTPRCNNLYTQGVNATNSSPFIVNHRPSFTSFVDSSPGDPGTVVTFYSTSSDSDTSGTADTVKLIVCATAAFSTTTDSCSGTTLGSTTVFASANATATYTIVIPTQDNDYGAYGYIIDNHGFEATTTQGTNSILTVNNVAPSIPGANISINGGTDITLVNEAAQTTGFTLQFTASDNNSCLTAASTTEVTSYQLSLYRSGVASTTCTPTGTYNANNCYVSSVPTTTWNLSCTASTTSCTGASDTDQVWNCTFPLWYIADPTDGTATSTQYPTQNWLAQVRGIDDDAATGSLSESTVGVEVRSLLAFALDTLTIPYGALEPGQQNDPLIATTTARATGNVGLDKTVEGESMCTSYTASTLCPTSATSTIPESEQRFATGTVTYASGVALSSTTPQEVEINVPKSTATSTQATASAYWGIRVPATISFAGFYYGQNTFYAVQGESVNW
jgi:hypothetical protein